MEDTERLQSYMTELRRGTLVLTVLGSLKEPRYGYALLQTLQSSGVEIEANTLYPLMRRLESQGLLNSSWDTTESRPRKYYVLSDEGDALYRALRRAWQKLGEQIKSICNMEDDKDEYPD